MGPWQTAQETSTCGAGVLDSWCQGQFGASIDPSGQNQLYPTTLQSNIWDLSTTKIFLKDPFRCTSIKVFEEHGFINASKPVCGESCNITFVSDEGIFFLQRIILCFLALKQHFFFSERQCFIQWTNESRLSQDWEMVWTISNLVCFTLSDKAETFIRGRELRSLVE